MRGMTRTPLEMDWRFLRIQCSTSGRQDDFYFWLVDGGTFDQVPQDVSWSSDAAIDRNDYLAGIATDLLAWSKRKTVRLAWCRLRDGIEDDVRLSDYGLPVSNAPSVGIDFDKRDGDLLVFLVNGASNPQHRFIYDPGENVARVLTNWTILPTPHAGGLPSFPHFIATVPGEPAAPATFEAPVLLVQKHLRLEGQTDAAREWLEFLYKPLARSNGWLDPDGLAGRPNARILLLNWLETVLELAETQLAAHHLAITECSRETLALVRKVLGQRPRKIAHDVTAAPVNLAAFVPDVAPLNSRVARLWDRAEILAAAIAGCDVGVCEMLACSRPCRPPRADYRPMLTAACLTKGCGDRNTTSCISTATNGSFRLRTTASASSWKKRSSCVPTQGDSARSSYPPSRRGTRRNWPCCTASTRCRSIACCSTCANRNGAKRIGSPRRCKKRAKCSSSRGGTSRSLLAPGLILMRRLISATSGRQKILPSKQVLATVLHSFCCKFPRYMSAYVRW